MARSHAIWVVLEPSSDKPVSVFTVRHELKTWFEEFGQEYHRIFRCIDNPISTWRLPFRFGNAGVSETVKEIHAKDL